MTDDTRTALCAAAVLSGIGLLIVGVGKTVMTKTNPFVSGVENLLIGLVGGSSASPSAESSRVHQLLDAP